MWRVISDGGGDQPLLILSRLRDLNKYQESQFKTGKKAKSRKEKLRNFSKMSDLDRS